MNSTIKLIAIVCNPVNRAFSDYTHVVKSHYFHNVSIWLMFMTHTVKTFMNRQLPFKNLIKLNDHQSFFYLDDLHVYAVRGGERHFERSVNWTRVNRVVYSGDKTISVGRRWWWEVKAWGLWTIRQRLYQNIWRKKWRIRRRTVWKEKVMK